MKHFLQMNRLSIPILMILLCMLLPSAAQQAYFADGFHGGIYGHYPVNTYTQFLVDQLREHPSWCIGLEIEPETWDTVKVRTPEAYRQFKTMVEESGRVEYTNPSYAQSYLYPVSGESIIRQFQYGMRKLHSHFPSMTFTTYATEEPCFTSCLPQILSQLGFRYAVLKCPDTCWGGYTEAFGGEIVNWIGPDGTSLPTVPRYECEALQPGSVWQTIAWKNSSEYIEACRQAGIRHPVGMCYQDAGWTFGPWLRKDSISKYILWSDYIENIADRSKAIDYRMTQEGVKVALVWGSQVMQRIGQQVRHAENMLLDAERIGAARYVLTGVKPDQAAIDEAWRTLMLAQHHDSWIVPYNRLNNQGTWADNIALWTDATCHKAGRIIGASLPMSGGRTFYFNTTGKSRREVVTATDDGGQLVDVLVDAPSFGFVEAIPSAGKKMKNFSTVKTKNDRAVVENSQYRLIFDLAHGGVLTSLYDKRVKREMVDRSSPYGFGELRGYFPRVSRFCSSRESRAEVDVVKSTPYVTSICISGKVAGVVFSQTYTLKYDDPLIDVDLIVDWKENVRVGNHFKRSRRNRTVAFYNTKYNLNVMFPAAIDDARLWKNAPFDVCESRLDSTFFDRWTDINHNIIHSWLDISNGQTGLALFSDHTTSYSFSEDYPLALTVQYSGPGLWGRDHKITGRTQMHYALMPHRGRWDTAGISDANERWNHPLINVNVNDNDNDNDDDDDDDDDDEGTMNDNENDNENANDDGTSTLYTLHSTLKLPLRGIRGSLISLDGTGYQLSAFTAEPDGTLLLRLFNADGDDTPCRIPLGFTVSDVEEVDLRGKPCESGEWKKENEKPAVIIKDGIDTASLQVTIPRFGIRNYKLYR